MTAPRREFAEPSAHYRGVRTRDYSVPRNEPIVAPNETGRIAVLKDRLADPSFPPRALLIILSGERTEARAGLPLRGKFPALD